MRLRVEQKERFVNGVIRQAMRQISMILSENIVDLPLDDIGICLKMLSRFRRSLAALESRVES